MKVLNINSKRKLSFSDSLIISVFIIFTAFGSSAQIAVNTDGSSADASAMIDIKSTAKGFLGPRMTEAQKNAISSPATGLLVYQTDGIPGYYYYTGSSWTKFGTGTGSSQWTTTGNDIYYTTGNVGIGTDSPVSKLQVAGHIRTNDGGRIVFPASSNNLWNIDNSGGELRIFREDYNASGAGSNGAVRVQIKNDGKVGIGTSSPEAKLHIGSADGDAAIKISNKAFLEFGAGLTKETNAGKIGYELFTAGALDIVGAGTTGSNRKVQFYAEGGTTFNGGVKASLFTGNGDEDSGMYSNADGTLNFKTNNSEVVRFTDRIYSSGGYSFLTNDTDGGIYSPADGTMTFHTNGAERMRITSSAGILTSPESAHGLTVKGTGDDLPIKVIPGTPAGNQFWKLGPNGAGSNDFYIYAHTGNYVHVNDEGGGWTGPSDIRLKENIVPIQNALDGIMHLRGVKFNFIGRESTEIGVIAQEVQAQFPELVSEDFNGYLGVGYDRLGPILIEAIKEQQKQIEALKQEIEILKNK